MRDFWEYSLEKPCSQITEQQSVMQLLCTEYGEELQILMISGFLFSLVGF